MLNESIGLTTGTTYVSDDGLEDNYMLLLRGIVYQTVVDYSSALITLSKNPQNEEAYHTVGIAEWFFQSEDTGDMIARKIREQVLDNGMMFKRMNENLNMIPQPKHNVGRKKVKGAFAPMYVYHIRDADGKLITQGTLTEVSEAIGKSSGTIYHRYRHKFPPSEQNPYTVTRGGIEKE